MYFHKQIVNDASKFYKQNQLSHVYRCLIDIKRACTLMEMNLLSHNLKYMS